MRDSAPDGDGGVAGDGGDTGDAAVADPRVAIGVMSGTSLDGVDAACCRVVRSDPSDPFGYEVEVESFVERPYDRDLRDRILALCDDETGTVDEICRANVALASVFADAAEAARREAGRSTESVDLVASHGQTAWHAPERESYPGVGGPSRSTLQIGDGCVIAERTGIRTVSDFRAADVAAGGHGAPLAPFLDGACFAADDSVRAVQNVGGIGNCTLVPPAPGRDDLVAFDTGPGNMVVDAVVELVTDGDLTYDVDGELAAAGGVDDGLVAEFLDDPYFRRAPPKTTGRERFGREYARRFVAAARDRGCSDPDVVASATALTAQSIADAYAAFAPTYPDEVFVSGGGAENPTLLAMLDERVDCPVARSEAAGVGADRKEAALFALLGVARLDGVPSNVPAATGADRPVTMGKVSEVEP
ncbi:anhydro-N-acetylmuramic acid kinase [Halosimplex marinum]|uniref:anhydro-N-acetylmuramic acid kinase n=1 Tax=Halosimplex marinum TaxID=3396620 RepID=UPI003F56A781